MDKAGSSLNNLEYGLYPRASNHESAAEIGWLLYSIREQNEERISDMLSKLTGEIIGAKWRPIRTSVGARKKDDDETRTFAIHLECASDKVQAIRQQLSKWYGTGSNTFPDGTTMRLVPPFQSIISYSHKSKFASLVARQAALSSRLGTSKTWELTTNLILDRPEPKSGFTLRQLLMSIPSQAFPGTPLFHTVDRIWRSDNGIVFGFLPENEADARSFVAGMIPYLRATADPWFQKAFTEEAKIRHLNNKWDPKTRQIFSAEEAAVDGFLAQDDRLNKTDEPTLPTPAQEAHIEFNVPQVASSETFPTMYNDQDSVSTFNPKHQHDTESLQPSTTFTPKVVSQTSSASNTMSFPVPIDVDNQEGEDGSVSKLSDTESRISTLEEQFTTFTSQFSSAMKDLRKQTKKQAAKHDKTLTSILELLKSQHISDLQETNEFEVNSLASGQSSVPSDMANHQDQMSLAGGSIGTAGSGS